MSDYLDYYQGELEALEDVMKTCGNSGMMRVFEARKKDLLQLIEDCKEDEK